MVDNNYESGRTQTQLEDARLANLTLRDKLAQVFEERDELQAEVDSLRSALETAEAKVDSLERDLEDEEIACDAMEQECELVTQDFVKLRKQLTHTDQWYAMRFKTLGDWAREHGHDEVFNILANNKVNVQDITPPTYDQQMNLLRQQLERAQDEIADLKTQRNIHRETALLLDEYIRVFGKPDEVLQNQPEQAQIQVAKRLLEEEQG